MRNSLHRNCQHTLARNRVSCGYLLMKAFMERIIESFCNVTSPNLGLRLVEKTIPKKIYKKLPNRIEFNKRRAIIDPMKYGRDFSSF